MNKVTRERGKAASAPGCLLTLFFFPPDSQKHRNITQESEMPLTEPAIQSRGPGMKSSTGDSDWQHWCVWTGTLVHGWFSKPSWLHLKIIPKHVKKKKKKKKKLI